MGRRRRLACAKKTIRIKSVSKQVKQIKRVNGRSYDLGRIRD
jgi:hypothetical protein